MKRVCLPILLSFALARLAWAGADPLSSSSPSSPSTNSSPTKSDPAIITVPGLGGAPIAIKPMADQPLPAFVILGSSFAQNARLGDLEWSDAQFNAFLEGVRDAFHHNPQTFNKSAEELFTVMSARIQMLDRAQRIHDFQDPAFLAKYLKDMRKKLGLQETDSGLCYMVHGSGDALRASLQDTVVVSFDVMASDLETKLPQLTASRLRIKVADLLPGLAEGIQMMTLDGKAIFLLPPTLSYGAGKWPDGVDQNTPLIYRVTLHEIQAAPPASS